MQCTPPAVEDCLSDPAKGCATCQAAPNALKCATCATAGWVVNAAGVVSATLVQNVVVLHAEHICYNTHCCCGSCVARGRPPR